MTTEEFIKAVNALRLANKGKWYFAEYTVNGKSIQIKGYNTWLQIFRVNGINQNSIMDISVTEFKKALEQGVK